MESTKKLKIYLGDMTYDTVTLSTETFPLNIGFIASYCIKKFGNNVEITLFKYIEELEDALSNVVNTGDCVTEQFAGSLLNSINKIMYTIGVMVLGQLLFVITRALM